jgi:hypothetical protein
LPTLDSELVAAPPPCLNMMRAAVYTGDSECRWSRCRRPPSGRANSSFAWRAAASAIPISRKSNTICLRRRAFLAMRPPAWWRHRRGRARILRRRSRHRLPSHPLRECFYCRHKLYAQCPVYKKGGRHGRLRAGGRRLFAICARDGLDRPARRRKDSRRRFFRPRVFCRAGEHLREGRGPTGPAAEDVVVILGQGPIGLLFTACW